MDAGLAPMALTAEEESILAGERGPVAQKALRSVVLYGSIFGAERLVPIAGGQHFVTSFGANMIGPYFRMVDELLGAGLRPAAPFTVDPRPLDHANVPTNLLEKLSFRLIFGRQAAYEKQLTRLGLRNADGFTCTCYLPEVGNTPRWGDVLVWSESSAVVFANSVLGARSNRNSAGIDVLCAVLGKAPLFGFLTDAGRRATWLVELRTSRLPNPQLLGGAIGRRVVEDVPYIAGLDRYLDPVPAAGTVDYLKDLGAASASNGAVGLFHAEGITPEARDGGRSLLAEGYRTYVVDDDELRQVKASYPMLWKNPRAKPALCFIGCPHLSLNQVYEWSERLQAALEQAGRSRLAVPTVLCAAPGVATHFRGDRVAHAGLLATGARLSSLCPLMWLNNPLCARRPVVTNSNKLRTYTAARFYMDEATAAIAATGTIEEADDAGF